MCFLRVISLVMSEMVQQGSTVELQFLSGNQYVIKRATERTENLNIQFSFKGNEKDIAWDRHKNVCVCGGGGEGRGYQLMDPNPPLLTTVSPMAIHVQANNKKNLQRFASTLK